MRRPVANTDVSGIDLPAGQYRLGRAVTSGITRNKISNNPNQSTAAIASSHASQIRAIPGAMVRPAC
jgi:hypothetical protein